MLDRQSDVSRLVARLAVKNLVVRGVSEQDRRKMDAMLTENGQKILSHVDRQLSEYQIFLPNLEDQEIDATNVLLDKLCGQPIEKI